MGNKKKIVRADDKQKVYVKRVITRESLIDRIEKSISYATNPALYGPRNKFVGLSKNELEIELGADKLREVARTAPVIAARTWFLPAISCGCPLTTAKLVDVIGKNDEIPIEKRKDPANNEVQNRF